jgi:hypothetical protein
MRPLLNEVRRARSPELQQTLWTRFKELYSVASSVINCIQKNWFNKEGRLEKWAFFHREVRYATVTFHVDNYYYQHLTHTSVFNIVFIFSLGWACCHDQQLDRVVACSFEGRSS